MRWQITKKYMVGILFATVVLAGSVAQHAQARQSNNVSFRVYHLINQPGYSLTTVVRLSDVRKSIKVDIGSSVFQATDAMWVAPAFADNAKALSRITKSDSITATEANGRSLHFTVRDTVNANGHTVIILQYTGASAPVGQPKASRS